MKRTGITTLPLHHGKAPKWLFSRMSQLAGQIARAVIVEFGRDELLRKMSDPYWFQSFGCVLGFDWHSSGLTTTVTGALKEGLKGMERELGLYVCGGKGATSRKTPHHIRGYADKSGFDPEPFIFASKMSAKVDNTAVQDGYQLYHHVFIVTGDGNWAVLQQGMNEDTGTARRYHWLGENVDCFVVEPHSAVCCDWRGRVLNMVARESAEARDMSVLLSKEDPDRVMREISLLNDPEKARSLNMPGRHAVWEKDISPGRLKKTFLKTYEIQPGGFEELLAIPGVGPKSVRALSLVSELLYGKAPSYEDPARFSFAHGGKDGTPYPVDKKVYDETIETVQKAIESSKVGNRDKMEAIKRLSRYFEF